MAQMKPRTLSGFMELLPGRQVQFDRMVDILRKTYSLYGFTPLTLPSLKPAKSCWPRVAERLRNRSTALPREILISPCASI